MAKPGTRAKIDLVELEKLAILQCTDQEIASWFNVTTRTIERRRKERKFAEVMERGRAKGRISVRRMQMKLLEKGNHVMGIWLGKQLLGQRDTFPEFPEGGALVSVIAMPRCEPTPATAPKALPACVIDIGPARSLAPTITAGYSEIETDD